MKIHLSEIDISTWIYETGLGKKIRISLNFPCLSLLTQLFALAFFVIVLCRSGCRQNFFPFSVPSRPAPAARVTWRRLGTSQAPGVHTTRKLYIIRVRGKLLRNVWTPPSLLTGRGVIVRTHWSLLNIMFINIWTIKIVRQFVSLRLILATAFDSVNYSLLLTTQFTH